MDNINYLVCSDADSSILIFDTMYLSLLYKTELKESKIINLICKGSVLFLLFDNKISYVDLMTNTIIHEDKQKFPGKLSPKICLYTIEDGVNYLILGFFYSYKVLIISVPSKLNELINLKIKSSSNCLIR